MLYEEDLKLLNSMLEDYETEDSDEEALINKIKTINEIIDKQLEIQELQKSIVKEK